MLSPSTPTCTLARVTATTRPYHHGNLRPALLSAAERALAGGRRAVAARARAGGRRQPRGAAAALRRQAGAARRARAGRLRAAGRARWRGARRRGPAFARGWARSRATYVRFATEHAALLELMYAGKHRPAPTRCARRPTARSPAPLALIAEGQAAGEIVGGDRERAGHGRLGRRSTGSPRWPTAACSATRRSSRSSTRPWRGCSKACARASAARTTRPPRGRGRRRGCARRW